MSLLSPPCIFPLVTRCRRQFLCKMWPIQFAFRLRISCRIFLCSLTLSNTSSFLTWSVQLIFSILLQHHISKLSRYFWGHPTQLRISRGSTGLINHITTDHKEEEQLEDRRNVGENSSKSGDGTDQRVQSLMFMMIVMMIYHLKGSNLFSLFRIFFKTYIYIYSITFQNTGN